MQLIGAPCTDINRLAQHANGIYDSSMDPQALTTAAGVSLTVEVSPLQYCRHAHITIRAAPNTTIDLSAVDTDAPGSGVGLQVFAVLWTNSSEPGTPCISMGDVNCSRVWKQLPLVYWPGEDALVAVLVPDRASSLYSFVVQV